MMPKTCSNYQRRRRHHHHHSNVFLKIAAHDAVQQRWFQKYLCEWALIDGANQIFFHSNLYAKNAYPINVCAGLFVCFFRTPEEKNHLFLYVKKREEKKEKCGYKIQTINAGSNGWARKILLLIESMAYFNVIILLEWFCVENIIYKYECVCWHLTINLLNLLDLIKSEIVTLPFI